MKDSTGIAPDTERGPKDPEIFTARELSHVSYHSYNSGFHAGVVYAIAAVGLGMVAGYLAVGLSKRIG
jgi:hypothetical protein